MVRRLLLGCVAVVWLQSAAIAEGPRFRLEYYEWTPSAERPEREKVPFEITPAGAKSRVLPAGVKPRMSLTVPATFGEPFVSKARFGDESLILSGEAVQRKDGVESAFAFEHCKLDWEAGCKVGSRVFPGRDGERISTSVVVKWGERWVHSLGTSTTADAAGRKHRSCKAFTLTALRGKSPRSSHGN